jgi:hypothetical protein
MQNVSPTAQLALKFDLQYTLQFTTMTHLEYAMRGAAAGDVDICGLLLIPGKI